MALTLLPWGALGLAYRIPILLTDLLFTFFVIRLLRSRTPAEGRSAMRALYLSGALGLLAFLIGSTRARKAITMGMSISPSKQPACTEPAPGYEL